MSNPLIGNFILAWVVTNWKIVYVTFFISEEFFMENDFAKQFPLGKVSYISSLYAFFDVSRPFLVFTTWLHLIVIPATTAYLLVWQLPKLSIIAKLRNIDFHNQEERAIFLKESARNKERSETATKEERAKQVQLDEQKKTLEKELALARAEVKKEQENLSLERERISQHAKKVREEQEERKSWESDYQKFLKTPFAQDFDTLYRSVYEHHGRVDVWQDETQTRFFVPTDILAFAHVNNIITFSEDGIISLSDKGNFFLKKYLESQNIRKSEDGRVDIRDLPF